MVLRVQGTLQVYIFKTNSVVDPVTKKFLSDSMQKVFGFPTFVRFSWSTIPRLIIDQHGVPVRWKEDVKKVDKKRRKCDSSVLCVLHHVE